VRLALVLLLVGSCARQTTPCVSIPTAPCKTRVVVERCPKEVAPEPPPPVEEDEGDDD
jgi:hypothetical protein